MQGHIAYPDLAKNPIHYVGDLINKLNNFNWDNGNKYFPKTSFQISSIKSDNVASNMIPGSVDIIFNLRFSNELTQETIKEKFKNILNDLNCSMKYLGIVLLNHLLQMRKTYKNPSRYN